MDTVSPGMDPIDPSHMEKKISIDSDRADSVPRRGMYFKFHSAHGDETCTAESDTVVTVDYNELGCATIITCRSQSDDELLHVEPSKDPVGADDVFMVSAEYDAQGNLTILRRDGQTCTFLPPHAPTNQEEESNNG